MTCFFSLDLICLQEILNYIYGSHLCSHCISLNCSLASAMMRKRNEYEHWKRRQKSSFADNWVSDKKICKIHLKTTQPEGEFTNVFGCQINKNRVFLCTSNDQSEKEQEKDVRHNSKSNFKILHVHNTLFKHLYVCTKC